MRERRDVASSSELFAFILETLEALMGVTDALAQAISDLESQESTLEGAVAAAAAEVKTLAHQVVALEQQAQTGTVTAGDLQPLKDRVAAVASKLTGQSAAASEAAAEGVADTQRSLYTFSGDPATVDASQWADSGLQTEDGRKLYFYSGDSAPGDTKGDGLDGGAWVRYVGPTVPEAATPPPADAPPAPA